MLNSASHPESLPDFLMPLPLTHQAHLDEEDRELMAALERVEQARNHLEHYVQHTVLDEGMTPAAHHRVICRVITEMVVDDKYDEVIVNIPPGGGKSIYTSHGLAAWFMGRYPHKNIIMATHTAELAERWSRRVRNTIMDRRHRRLFPESQLSKDSTAVGRWATTVGGEFLAAGAGASILGFRSDLQIIDDPIGGIEDAQSETQLAKLHQWYENDLVTRMKPGGKMILICQRLSPNDLAGYLIARNAENPTRRQKLVIMRMEYEEGDEDGTGRSPGERLWPEWFTAEMVADARRDDYKWRTLYQQRPPSDEGSWVSKENILVVSPTDVPATLSTYICSDLALSVNTGDYSVHLVCGVDSDNNIHVLDAQRGRTSPEVTVERHLDLIETYKPLECLIDDDNAAKVYVHLLASRARERSIPVPWKTMPMRGQDKETRAASLRGLFRRRKVFIKRADWNHWLIRELMMFPNAMGEGVDDGVDALGLIGRRLAHLAKPAAAAEAKPRVKYAHEATLAELWEDHDRTTYRTVRI